MTQQTPKKVTEKVAQRAAEQLTELLVKHKSRIGIKYTSGHGSTAVRVKLHSRTPANLELLRKAFHDQYGNHTKTDIKGRHCITAPIGQIRLVSTIGPECKPPDAIVEVSAGYTAALTKALREKKLHKKTIWD